MAYYYSLRGWLEVSHEDLSLITDKIQSLRIKYANNQKLNLYMNGWCWNDAVINWTHYVFYGVDVNIEGIDLLQEVLNDIISMNLKVSGYFHAQGEDGAENFIYKLSEDKLTVG